MHKIKALLASTNIYLLLQDKVQVVGKITSCIR